MDFEFSPEEQAFAEEVATYLQEVHSDDVMQPWKENFTQLVDTKPKRKFMKTLGEKGWLGITWPKELGGQEGSGISEYLLNEALAYVGAPQIGKGVGIIGKTLIRHGSDKLKAEFLPKILNNEVEFAVGYSEPPGWLRRRQHAAQSRQGRRRVEPQRPEDLDHIRPLCGLVLGRRTNQPGSQETCGH